MTSGGRGWIEVGEWGEMSFAEQTRITHGRQPGAERLTQTPADDPWYDVSPGPPVLPDVDHSTWGRHLIARQAAVG